MKKNSRHNKDCDLLIKENEIWIIMFFMNNECYHNYGQWKNDGWI